MFCNVYNVHFVKHETIRVLHSELVLCLQLLNVAALQHKHASAELPACSGIKCKLHETVFIHFANKKIEINTVHSLNAKW